MGVRVQIHSQEEPPTIDQLGFGAAPGYQTFVSCQQQRVSLPPPYQGSQSPPSAHNTSDCPRGLHPSACYPSDSSHWTWVPYSCQKPP